ncbi:MAG TPA: DNA mismatch repair endonuclease MutL, partial [Gammaproteobacteria bacterium]|nr:DNA mismatch repair endonuclease MutL [Gammaproteobacteria bacterium]
GEALASINSVAKLSITAQTVDQEHAWTISVNKIVPAAHPVGTTVKVQDLFYNLPARRKFLRSERTEYLHLEEVFRRIALSNFEVAFTLSNQGKLSKSLPACKDQASKVRRVINLCGQQVMEHAFTIDAEQNGMQLWGWVGAAHAARSQEAHQYFFINGRVIRDRLINHAIRQVYQPLCVDGKMPFYCLYLELDPVALDVNVHPTKHEVRFRDARIIHAFLTQVLQAALTESMQEQQAVIHDQTFVNKFNFNPSGEFTDQHTQVLCILENKIIVAQHGGNLLLIDGIATRKALILRELQSNNIASALDHAQTVMLPAGLQIDDGFLEWCRQCGIEMDRVGPQKLLVRALPKVLHQEQIDFRLMLQRLRTLWVTDAAPQNAHTEIVSALHFVDLPIVSAQKMLQQARFSADTLVCKEFSVGALQALLE